MGSSAGRRSAAYVRAREVFKTGNYPCALASGPWCTGRGTTVEHSPPLSTAPRPELWRGVYLPACPECQHRQGAQIRNGNHWSW